METAFMQPLRFSVVIPVFNKWELTSACLRSLREFTPGDAFEVIVVDNASSDATRADLNPLGESLFGRQFKSIRHEINLNFAAACNAGAKLAGAGLYFFLNNDTLLTENWAPPLEQTLQNDPVLGAVGPLLLYADNTVQHLGVAFSSRGLFHLYRGFPATHPLVAKIRSFQAITAAAFLVHRDLFWEAGAFYEGYRNGFEDVELCLRMGKLGKKFTCAPSSRVIHLESQSPGRHDANEHNSELLHQRCFADYFPDYHIHGLRDGFQVVCDDSLGENLILNEKDDLALRKQVMSTRARSRAPDLNKLYRSIQENPYWLWGHETMGQELENGKKFVEAAVFYVKAFNICSTLSGIRRVLKIASIMGDAGLMKMSGEYLAKFLALTTDAACYTATLRRNMDVAARCRDNFLLRLYEQKLVELQKGKHT
jgi:GT2 family glycosyltransferase